MFQHNCFQCQIRSIPGYCSCSSPQYSCSNLFQFSSCCGSKNCYCFQHEDSNMYYCFHRNYCVTAFLSIGQYSTVFLILLSMYVGIQYDFIALWWVCHYLNEQLHHDCGEWINADIWTIKINFSIFINYSSSLRHSPPCSHILTLSHFPSCS